jgi:hypothetical protein
MADEVKKERDNDLVGHFVKPEEPVKPTVDEVSATDEAKPEEPVKPKVDETAIRLSKLEDSALDASALAECQIAASQSLKTYAGAGDAHRNAILCRKASLDHESARDGVASKWSESIYWKQIGEIVIRVRAESPESFHESDSNVKEERSVIHKRILVGYMAQLLVPLIGDRAWEIPYRLVRNYLTADHILFFQPATVEGKIKDGYVEFLKTQLLLLIDKKSNTTSFLNALKEHRESLKKAAQDVVNANKTPEQRKTDEKVKEAKKVAGKAVDDEGAVKKKLAESLAAAVNGKLSPVEVVNMVRKAAKDADVELPLEKKIVHNIAKVDVATVTSEELKTFLVNVAAKGGADKAERRAIVQMIIRHGSDLADRQKARRQQIAASNGQHAAAMAS